MKNIIKKFYNEFDKFLEHASSGNLRLKVKINAIVTSILILIIIITFAIAAFWKFEITSSTKTETNIIVQKKLYQLLLR